MERAVAADLAAHGPVSGESFRYMRKVVGLTGGELAWLIGVAFETVSKWETGVREVDRAAWLVMSFLAADRAKGRSVARRRLEELATDGRLPKVTTLKPPPTVPTLGEVLELATGRPHYTDKNVAELLQTDLSAVRSGLSRLRKRGIVECVASHADESKTWELLVDSLGTALVRAAEAGIDVDEEVRAAHE